MESEPQTEGARLPSDTLLSESDDAGEARSRWNVAAWLFVSSAISVFAMAMPEIARMIAVDELGLSVSLNVFVWCALSAILSAIVAWVLFRVFLEDGAPASVWHGSIVALGLVMLSAPLFQAAGMGRGLPFAAYHALAFSLWAWPLLLATTSPVVVGAWAAAALGSSDVVAPKRPPLYWLAPATVWAGLVGMAIWYSVRILSAA